MRILLGLSSALVFAATAAGIEINKHRVISGLAPKGAYVSCLDTGSCKTQASDIDGSFQLVLWNSNCKCDRIIARQRPNRLLAPSRSSTALASTGSPIDLRLCQHRVSSPFGPGKTFEECDAFTDDDSIASFWFLVTLCGGLMSYIASAAMAQQGGRSEELPAAASLTYDHARSESGSSYESVSDEESCQQKAVVACDHVIENDDTDGYNLRRDCQKCAARTAKARVRVAESGGAPTASAIADFVFADCA